MTIKKITKRDRYAEMREIFEGMGKTELVEFIDHEVALLDKKNATKSARQVAEDEKRAALADAVIAILANADEGMTCTDLTKALPAEMGEVSTQKMTPVLTKLVGEGELTKMVKGGKSIYALA